MRKGIVISITMLIFSLAVFTCLSAEIAKQADMVEFEETLLEGDRKAAEGITVKIHATDHDDNKWNLSYSVGSEESFSYTADYHRGYRQEPQKLHRDETISLKSYSPNYSFSALKDSPEKRISETWLAKIVTDLTEKVSAGETIRERFMLSDYISHQPLALYISSYSDIYQLSDVAPDGSDYDLSYFKVPVSKEHTFTVYLAKNDAGQLETVEIIGSASSDINSSGIIADDRCYMAVSHPSEVPGIHRIPLTLKDRGKPTAFLEMAQAELVYPLTHGERVMALEQAADEKTLFLVTSDSKDIMLSVLEEGDEGQLLLLHKQKLLDLYNEFSSEDIAFAQNRNLTTLFFDSGDFFTIGSKESDYQVKHVGKLPEIPDTKMLLKNISLAEDSVYTDQSQCKTAVIIPINEENSGILEENLNHLLLVYEEGKLSYMGKYTCSLDNGRSYTNRQNTGVSLDGPVEVSW